MTATKIVTADSPIADLKLPATCTKALAEAKVTTVGHLTARTRAGIADTWLRQFLGDFDKAFAKHDLKFAPEGGTWNVCKSCPACPDCGSLRATEARNVVTDAITGQARHVGPQATPWCDSRNTHHRALVEARALELAGRLA